jgi:hypothetical protein
MSQKKFKLGITMAGAISAGAYTAGVMDYLFETLEKWEAAKKKNREIGEGNAGYDESVPMHDVEIEILSGASAGGMTAVIAAAGLQKDFKPVTPASRGDKAVTTQNPFYHTWVDLTQDDMLPVLFDTSDVKSNLGVVSILNSGFKDEISSRVISQAAAGEYYRPYVAPRLQVMVSLSNLNGIPFDIGFKGNADKTNLYRTTSHRDYAHFVIDDAYKSDGLIPVSFAKNQNLTTMRQAAMATGAFPIGLAARTVDRERKYLDDNKYINPLYGEEGYQLNISDDVSTLNSDGGMLNNEPFDITGAILQDITGQKKPASENHNTFESTVLMVDPFPSEPEDLETLKSKKLSPKIFSVAGLLISTMRGELSFKRDELEVAFDEANYSRFLVAPKRHGLGGKEFQGNAAIACGSLGGFGGFFEKSFRAHDFYLGRRNAQYFLRRHFSIPSDTANPIFNTGYNDAAKDRFAIKFAAGGPSFMPIIPDLEYDKNDLSKNSEPLGPEDWPKFDSRNFKNLQKLVIKRLEKVIAVMANLKGLFKLLGWIGIQIFKKKIGKAVIGIIEKDFRKRDLLK